MNDREPIKHMTRAWVEENTKRVTSRDKELLQIIAENKIVTRDQLLTLHPSFEGKKQSINVINRRIKVLYECHCIDKVHPPVGVLEGSSQAHITLDRAGAILLGIENFRSIIIEDPSIYPPKRLPQYYKHTRGIVDLRCSLTELLREKGGQIKAWAVEDENKVEFKFKKSFMLKPDVLAIIQKPDKTGAIFFYEHDQGTEYKRTIQEKIESYTAYRLSNAWLSTQWAKIMKMPTFPPVIILTTGDEKRIRWMKEVAGKGSINTIVDHVDMVKEILNRVIWGIE